MEYWKSKIIVSIRIWKETRCNINFSVKCPHFSILTYPFQMQIDIQLFYITNSSPSRNTFTRKKLFVVNFIRWILSIYLEAQFLVFICTMIFTNFRFGEVREVTDTVLFLLSDKASVITSVCLPVDGGYTSS